jgi:hypothetical protein
MSPQTRRILRITVTLLVLAIVLNDAVRFGTAYTRVITAARDGLDAAGAAVLGGRNGVRPAQEAIAAKGAVLAAYEAKRQNTGTAKTADIRMIIRTTAPGMIVIGPILNSSAGIPSGQWWTYPPVIDWPADRTLNLTTGMTIN